MANANNMGVIDDPPADGWMSKTATRAFMGDMPESTFWDLRQDETQGFPKPAKVRGRPMWSRRQVQAWMLLRQESA